MKALLFDTETSGLFRYDRRADEAGQPRMCSVAASLVDDGHVIRTMNRIILPDETWEPEHIADAKAGTGAFAVNGLTYDRMWEEGVPVLGVLEEFDSMVDECEGIAAFNVDFDQKVMRAEMRRAGRPDRYGERPIFCVMKAATPLCKMVPTDKMMAAGIRFNKNPKLMEAVTLLLGADHAGAHDAARDTSALVDLYLHMASLPGVVVWQPQVTKKVMI